MSKSNKSARSAQRPARHEWPLVIYVWIIGLGFTGYLVARIALDGQPHPVHWASGLIAGILGYFVGWLWYRWCGDII